jgi:predicted trehalose synthase
MTRWPRLRRHLLGATPEATVTTPSKETSMTNPTGTSLLVDERLAALQEQLAEVEQEKLLDPITEADDVAAWRDRDTDRTNRALDLAQQIQDVKRHGALVADPTVAAALATFAKASEDPRRTLAPIIRTGDLGRRNLSGQNGPLQAITLWWRTLQALIAALPHTDPAAQELLRSELDQWFHARSRVYVAALAQLGHYEFPHPEGDDGALPAGLRLGVHASNA